MTEKPTRLKLFTVGHSTRTIAEFKKLLAAHGIKDVVDIRTIPKSRHNPQFNEARLRRSLAAAGIGYRHLKELGGLRHTSKESKNLGWRNLSFRGYADYMATPEFAQGLAALMRLARRRKTAIMCAEAVPWRCHRSLVSDAFLKKGWDVFHIMSEKTLSKHHATPFLRVRRGILMYPPITKAAGKK